MATPLHTNTSTRLVDSERRVGAAAGSMKRLSVRPAVPPSWASTPLERPHFRSRERNCHWKSAPMLSKLQQQVQPFNGLFSRTTWVSRYQKGKTNLDFTGARDSEWQWHHLGHIIQVCTSLQTDNHASTPPLCFFTGRMPFLPPKPQPTASKH